MASSNFDLEKERARLRAMMDAQSGRAGAQDAPAPENAADAPAETPGTEPPFAHVQPNVWDRAADDEANAFVRSLMTVGSPVCAAFWAVLGIVLAVLLLTIGLWRTLFIATLAALGAFLGGVRSKSRFFRDLINRLFPPKG